MSARAVLRTVGLAAFRIGATLLALTAAAAVLLVLVNLGRPFIEPKPLGTIIPMALAGAVTGIASATGLALAWRAASRPSARALAWFLGFLALFWGLAFVLIFVDREAAGIPAALAGIDARAPFEMNAAMWLMAAAFLRFSALFPRPLTPDDLNAAVQDAGGGFDSRSKAVRAARRIAVAPVPVRVRNAFTNRRRRPLRALRRVLLDPAPVWAPAWFFGSVPIVLLDVLPFLGLDGGPAQDSWLAGLAGALFSVFFLLFFLLVLPGVIVLAAKNLRLNYALAGPEDRRRIRWIVDGCVIGVASLFASPILELVVSALGLDHPVYQGLPTALLTGSTLVMVVCLAVGVFYDGALEPALVIRRNALYAAFGVLLTFLFAGVESLVSSHLTEQLGLPASTGAFVAGGAVALAFGPLRKPVGRLVERWSASRPEDAPEVVA